MPPDIPVVQIVGWDKQIVVPPEPEQLVESLRQQIARLEGARRPASDAPVSSGCGSLDDLLPRHGFQRGTLVEWLVAGEGSGAESLALRAAREACGLSI